MGKYYILKFLIKSDLFTPKVEKPNMNRYFLEKLAQDMVKILKREIKGESFQAPAKELIQSWKYKVQGKNIIIWSDHPAMTGRPEDVIEEEVEREPLEMEEIDIPEDPREAMKVLRAIPNVIVIQDSGKIVVRPVSAKRLKSGDWMFPAHRRSAFLERSQKKVTALIRSRVQGQIREAIG